MIFTKNIIPCKMPASIIIILLLTMPLSNLCSELLALPQEECKEILRKANEAYVNGRFDEALILIDECLAKPDLSRDEKLNAYRLKGLVYIAEDFLNEAREAINNLLELVPNYQPDPQDPPPFRDILEKEKKEREKDVQPEPTPPVSETPKKKGISKWVWIGGGFVITAVVTYFYLFSSDNGDKELPEPPELPYDR